MYSPYQTVAEKNNTSCSAPITFMNRSPLCMHDLFRYLHNAFTTIAFTWCHQPELHLPIDESTILLMRHHHDNQHAIDIIHIVNHRAPPDVQLTSSAAQTINWHLRCCFRYPPISQTMAPENHHQLTYWLDHSAINWLSHHTTHMYHH